jgi:hypothetical protein
MRRVLLAIVLLSAPALALAHHGQDFLIVDSPSVPHPGSAYLIANLDASLDGDSDSAFSPALLIGVSPRIGFELHAHLEKEVRESWRYAAVAPSLHVLLTDPAKHHGLKIGLSGEYEFGHGEAVDAAEARLSAENGSDRLKWAANLVASREQGGCTEFAATFGLRHQVHPSVAVGLEAQRGLDHADGAEVLASAYVGRNDDWTVKFGIGARRLEDGRNSPVAHLSVVLPLN